MTAPDIRGPARQAAAHTSDEPRAAGDASPCLAAESLDAYFGAARVVRDVSFGVPSGQVTAIIGPSGCGKSTLLRCLNRMHETVPGARVEGEVRFEGRDIYSPQVSAISVRRHIGMVFQRPTPFPTMSIRDNVAAGLKILPGRERPSRRETADIVERALRRAALWDEVKDRLDASAIDISGGQQQRLCIARALATSPTVLLLDEPTASLDPISTQRVEELVYELAIAGHDHHRHAQHAAGGPDLRSDRVHAQRGARRVFGDERHVHRPERSANRSVRDRTVRLSALVSTEPAAARPR